MKSPEPSPSFRQQLLVCFALKEEAAPFRQQLAARQDVSILVTGIGRKNAETSLTGFLRRQTPQCVLTCGFAGGLNPRLKLADVLFFTSDDLLARRLTAAGAGPASFFCAARIAITGAEKMELRRMTGADAVEMESEVIQSICRERKIPCATVRAVSDTVDEDLPLDFNRLAKADMNLDYAKLALAIARSPKKIPALMKLQKQTRQAAEALADVLGRIVSNDQAGEP